MTYKQKLNTELQDLRDGYKKADGKLKEEIINRADEIKILLENLCYQCKEEPRKYNEYFCSKECNDLYYKPVEVKEKHSISYMIKRLREMGRKEKLL